MSEARCRSRMAFRGCMTRIIMDGIYSHVECLTHEGFIEPGEFCCCCCCVFFNQLRARARTWKIFL